MFHENHKINVHFEDITRKLIKLKKLKLMTEYFSKKEENKENVVT